MTETPEMERGLLVALGLDVEQALEVLGPDPDADRALVVLDKLESQGFVVRLEDGNYQMSSTGLLAAFTILLEERAIHD